jgi:hypothetical protein
MRHKTAGYHGYTFPVWDLLLALAYSGTRNLGFTSRSNDEAIEVK